MVENTVTVWFTGATTGRKVIADGGFVGPSGELRLFVGDKITTIIAPGGWTFVQL